MVIDKSGAVPPPTELVLMQNWAEEPKRLVLTNDQEITPHERHDISCDAKLFAMTLRAGLSYPLALWHWPRLARVSRTPLRIDAFADIEALVKDTRLLCLEPRQQTSMPTYTHRV